MGERWLMDSIMKCSRPMMRSINKSVESITAGAGVVTGAAVVVPVVSAAGTAAGAAATVAGGATGAASSFNAAEGFNASCARAAVVKIPKVSKIRTVRISTSFNVIQLTEM